MNTFLMLAIVVLGTSGGDVLISSGMKRLGDVSRFKFSALAQIVRKMSTNTPFLAGLACMAASYGALMVTLSQADLSFVIPVVSMSYVTSTLGAKFVLKENITRLRWLGTLLICMGVFLISLR